MDLLEIMRTRRSIRKYTEEEIYRLNPSVFTLCSRLQNSFQQS